jgi:hypothetical protein
MLSSLLNIFESLKLALNISIDFLFLKSYKLKKISTTYLSQRFFFIIICYCFIYDICLLLSLEIYF